jgi:very-short-patch-repair endonuclease
MKIECRHRVHPRLLEHARQLRRPMTPAEAKLWRQLRGRQITELKFRRQHPLGPFVVDFYCPNAKIVIEIDGDSHALQEKYDRERTDWLNARGYRVLRFFNREVLQNIDGVLTKILEACAQASPSARPSP